MKKSSYQGYCQQMDRYGKIWTFLLLLMLFSFPLGLGLKYQAWPPLRAVLKGLLGIAPIFWTVAVIEVFTYVPMLGIGGSYLAFTTGNITNLKAPAAMNAINAIGAKADSEEAEVISTIAIACSSLVSTVVIALGVLAFSFLAPALENPALKPAFSQILPALFGALAVVFISKNWKLACTPLLVMSLLFLAVPSLSSAVGVLVPVGALLAIGAARFLYHRGSL